MIDKSILDEDTKMAIEIALTEREARLLASMARSAADFKTDSREKQEKAELEAIARQLESKLKTEI